MLTALTNHHKQLPRRLKMTSAGQMHHMLLTGLGKTKQTSANMDTAYEMKWYEIAVQAIPTPEENI